MAIDFEKVKKQLKQTSQPASNSINTSSYNNTSAKITASDIANIRTNARLNYKLEKLGTVEEEFTKERDEYYGSWRNADQIKSYQQKTKNYYNGLISFAEDLKTNAEAYKTLLGEDGYNQMLKNTTESVKNGKIEIEQAKKTGEFHGKFKSEDEFKQFQLQNRYSEITTFEEYQEYTQKNKERIAKKPKDEQEYLQRLGYMLEYQELLHDIDRMEERYDFITRPEAGAQMTPTQRNKMGEDSFRLKSNIQQAKKRLQEMDDMSGIYTGLNTQVLSESGHYAFDKRWGAFKNEFEKLKEKDAQKDKQRKLAGQKPKSKDYEEAAKSFPNYEAIWAESFANDDEKQLWGFIKTKYGDKKAKEYLDDLAISKLDQRQNQALSDELSNFAAQNPFTGFVGSAASIVAQLASGLEHAYYRGQGKDGKRSKLASAGEGLRAGTASQFESDLLRDVYNVGMSAADSVTAAAVGKFTGVTYLSDFLLGSSAAASTYNDALDRGVSHEDAALTATLAGITEGFFEHVSISKLFDASDVTKGLTKAGIKQIGKKVAADIGINFTEEAATEFTNIITDMQVNGYLSSYAYEVKNYYDQGMTEEEARKQAGIDLGKQIVEAGISGAFMGAGFSTVVSGNRAVKNQVQNRVVGNIVKQNLGDFKKLAQNVNYSSISDAAQKLTENSKPSEIGAVFNELYEATIEDSVRRMTPVLLENGATQGGSNSAEGWARQIANSVLNDSSNTRELSINKVTRDVYSAFIDKGEYGGSTLLALKEMATPAKVQAAVQGNFVNRDGATVDNEQGDNRYNTEQTPVLEGFPNDPIKNAVNYHKSNGSDIPLHVLGISKGSSLYNALSEAGLINEDGTVNAKAIITEYNRRNGITDSQSDNTAGGFVGESGIEYTPEQAEVLAKLPIEAIQNATDYFYNTDSDIPLNILSITKESSLYQELEAAELTNEDGTVFGQALIDERARRIEERRKARKPSKSITEAYGERVAANFEKERPTPTKTTNKKSWLQKVVGDAIITNEARSDESESTNADILEGRKVSTVGRGKNRIRTYGANTKIIRRELGDLYRGEGNDDISLAAGETAWLSKRDFGPAGKMGGGLEKSFLRNIRRVVSNGFDSIGRKLSPELQAKVSDTVFMEEDGTMFSFFHWSPNKFDEFKYGDGAFHCGTLQSALAIKNRSDKKVAGYIKEMYVISKNPFVLKDEGKFGAYAVAPQLEKFSIIDHNDLLRISQMDGFFSDRYNAEANVYVRGILESLGYDSYLYQNLDEDGGAWSVGVFNPDQIITIAENGVLKENSGVSEADSINGSAFSLLKKSEEQHSLNDTEYMAAVKKGDTETQKKIVADAAKSAGAILDEDGNPLKLYRGAKGGQKVFSKDTTHNGKIYTTNSLIIASNYSDKSGKITPIIDQIEGEPATYVLYGFPKKMLTMDAQALPFSDLVIPEELRKYSPDNFKATNAQIAEWAEQEGYDALHIKDVRDGGPFGWNDQYIFFDPNLVKSADVVTKDNNDNIIPPSERFDESIISDNAKQNKSFDKTGSNDGSVSFLPEDTNAVSKPIEQYSEERQDVIKNYLSATSKRLMRLIEVIKGGNTKFMRQKICDVSARAAKDIKNLLGIDVSGYTHDINTHGVQHILKRHGEKGTHDSTMSKDEDISRVGWVLENYDTVEVLYENGEQVYSKEFKGSDNKPAPQIRYIKKIDGTYYVVEAVADNSYKKLWVQSVYLQKNKEDVTQVPDADNVAPEMTAETDLPSPSSNPIISNESGKVNINNGEQQNTTTDTEDVNADADVQADNYAKEDKYWEAENENEKNVSKGLFDKIKNLFSHKNTDDVVSIGEIVKQIEKDFGVPVSTGKFKQKAYGIYKKKTEAIRTKVANALPTIAHEVGHHLDKRYGLRKLSSIKEAIQVLKDTRPDFYKSYPAKAIPGEAVAEFIRDYLADRTLAKNKYPKFYAEFESALLASKDGKTDLENLKGIGDMINRYFVAEKQERARAAIITRAEAKRRDRRNQTFDDILTKVKTNFVDEGEVLKKVSDEAHDLYDYSLKTFVRVQSNIEGDYLLGFDGEKVKKLDKNGNPIKDENGNDVYMPALTHLFNDIRTQAEQDAFELYLIYKHGLEFLDNGKRVFADDTINNKDYLTEEIKRLEAENPSFKEISENVYEWQRAIMYEYGVKSGLMKKETAEALWQKYPCYVPFNRDVKGEKGGKGKVGFVNQSSPVRNAKGSGLGIFNIYENIILKTQEFMLAADRNAVMQEIANTVDMTEGFGYLLEKVPPQQAPVKVSSDGTKYTIKNVLLDKLDSSDANALYNELDNAIGDLITDFQISNNQGLDIVSVYRNGERTYYQVHDKNLLKALLGLNKTQLNAVEATVGKATRLFKVMTTGGNPVWSIFSNAPRDFSSAYKYSIENNPFKYTLDYFKAVYYSFSPHIGKKGKHTNEYLKLYKALGGGYNSSYSDVKNLRYTVKNIIKLDKTMPQKVVHMFNVFHLIGNLSDAIETAPRLAEFIRVLKKTGDKQKALLAADNITVNFNRRGSIGKNIDQFLPYFNASIQGTTKYIDNLRHNKSFRVKTIVTTMFKVALLFSWNMLFMGDDDNDEYEKLSAYKKNNFYNIYMGDGKFFSIPKAKDTAYFESLVERLFETAFKKDVDWGQEVQDFAAYTWLCFGPPMFVDPNALLKGELDTDIIGLSTLNELGLNKDFKGSPIVPSAYEKLAPELQYDENTTWLAYGLGQLFGSSPMQIDHVIDSNLGWIGLINRSLFKMSGERDWSLGVGTKTFADNVYSSDILNHFYNNAEQFETKAKSYPNDGEAAAKNKQYTAAKSILSALNSYGKEDETAVRDYRIMARDYADNFEKNTVGNVDKRLISLYERTGDSAIFADKTFNREYSIDKVKYIMDSDIYLEYVDEYYSNINDLYNDILSIGASDEMTALMLTQAKQEITDLLDEKYKTEDGVLNTKVSSDWRDVVVDAMKDNISRKKKNGDISSSEKSELNRYLNNLN